MLKTPIFTPQKYQKYLRLYFNPNTPAKRLFVFHGTGAGKTCSSVLIAESYRHFYRENPKIEGKIYIIGSFITHNNFIKELTGPCGNAANGLPTDSDENVYLRASEREELAEMEKKIRPDTKNREYFAFKKLQKKYIMNRLRDAGYVFMTYKKFSTMGLNRINNSLIIVDEAHNLLNENEYSQQLNQLINNSTNLRVVLLSATPMFNAPEDIVEFVNLLFPDEDKLKHSNIFLQNGIALEKIQEKLRGIVSYVRGNNPASFPERIEVGEIPPFLKHTKIIRVPMSKLQMKYYPKYWRGLMSTEVRNLINFILPPAGGDDPLVVNIETELQYAPQEYQKKYLKFDKKTGFRGPALELKNLAEYAPKYHECIMRLNESSGKSFVFHSFVHNSGIRLFGDILRENGYEEYSSNTYRSNSRHYLTGETYEEWANKHKDQVFYPARYFVLKQEVPLFIRNRIISIFNSPDNIDGKYLKIILGSMLTKESLDTKGIMHVHILNYQENFSRLEQIIGRAIRQGSHRDLPPELRKTYVYKYVVSDIRGELSAEELEYQKDEENYIVIKRIERAIKESAIDCAWNRDFNIFPQNFEREKNGILCDYMENCDYKCKPGYSIPVTDPLQYRLYYGEYEIYDILTAIRGIFADNVIVDEESIVAMLREFDPDFIEIALYRMIIDKIPVTFRERSRGYLIKIGRNYVFQPENVSDLTIDVNLRITEFKDYQRKSNIAGILADLVEEERRISRVSIEQLKLELRKVNTYEEISAILSRVERLEQIKLLEYAIVEYYNAYNSNRKISPEVYNILLFFKSYLIDEKQLDTELLHSIQTPYFSSISEISISPDMLFIGHILADIAQIYNPKQGKFENITQDFIRRKSRKKLQENNIIVGYMDRTKHGEIVFKLRYPMQGSTRDRRKIPRGFVCRSSNDKKELLEIAKKLDISNLNETMKIASICQIIEDNLRMRQLKKENNMRWFYEYNLS